jgi:branched-subunit amino acid aminotransferase/4-amino-4-deoxychorismate lyase
MSGVAWLGEAGNPGQGRWGEPETLALPLAERGLLLADGVFETVLVLQGEPQLLAAHLARWRHGAALLGLPPPPTGELVRALLREAVGRSGVHSGALRLNWSRGCGPRGLSAPAPGGERFWLQLSRQAAVFNPVSVLLSRHERRNAASRLSQAKTLAYGQAIAARQEALAAGADEALLLSTAGGLCCGSSANLLLRRGDHWLTPARSSGCLPGVMREQALVQGLARECGEPLDPQELLHSEGAVLLNSLGCRPISHLDSTPLPRLANGAELFSALLRGWTDQKQPWVEMR